MSSLVVLLVFFLLAGMVGSAGKQSSQPRRRPGAPWNPPGTPPRRVWPREALDEPWSQSMPGAPVSAEGEEEPGESEAAAEKETVKPPVLSPQANAKPGADRAMNTRRQVDGPRMKATSEKAALEQGRENIAVPEPDKAAFEWTAEDLVQGVIWAEVLSRPRALRPFRGPRT